MVTATLYVLNSFRGQMETWNLILNVYYLIMGFSGVVIAFWIAIDGKRLERYSSNIRNLEKKLVTLERKIKIIKPRLHNKK